MMSHSQDLAARVAKALQDSGELDNLARQFLEAVGTLETHVVYDIGANVWLVVEPGWARYSRRRTTCISPSQGPKH